MTNGHYMLRPETLESLFLLYRATKDVKYRYWGWNIYKVGKAWENANKKALKLHCRTETGYSGVLDVQNLNAEKDNRMQAYFFSETLKYLYLLFCDENALNLNEFVLNTEAHLLRVFPGML